MLFLISYDEQKGTQNRFFSKRLKIKQNTARIEVDFQMTIDSTLG